MLINPDEYNTLYFKLRNFSRLDSRKLNAWDPIICSFCNHLSETLFKMKNIKYKNIIIKKESWATLLNIKLTKIYLILYN